MRARMGFLAVVAVLAGCAFPAEREAEGEPVVTSPGVSGMTPTLGPQPSCGEIITADREVLVRDFPASAAVEAELWRLQHPDATQSRISTGSCLAQNLVACPHDDEQICAAIGSTGYQTHPSLCHLLQTLRHQASAVGHAEAKLDGDACVAPVCAVALESDAQGATAVHVKNFIGAAEADAWFATQHPDAARQIWQGDCASLPACPPSEAHVCGDLEGAPAKTHGSACHFVAAVASAAGTLAEARGSYAPGPCASACDYQNPEKTYVADSAALCALIKYSCAAGAFPFVDGCGCGCQKMTK